LRLDMRGDHQILVSGALLLPVVVAVEDFLPLRKKQVGVASDPDLVQEI
jgi:hypothetical protein